MTSDSPFHPGTTAHTVPAGDAARQAVDSLKGYVYQVMVTALAWLDIDNDSRLFLEVAEDYASVATGALHSVQVKDTRRSGAVTLNSKSVRDAVASFVDLVSRNPDSRVDLRFFTTSEIGKERAVADRPNGIAGLEYWRKVAGGNDDPQPLRRILESNRFAPSVRAFSRARDDTAFRRDLIARIHWDCGKPDFSTLRQELEERLIVLGRDRFNLPAFEASRLADQLVYQVLQTSVASAPQNRVLTRDQLYEAIDRATRFSVPRADVDTLIRFASTSLMSLAGAVATKKALSVSDTALLIDGDTLPLPKGIIARALESTIDDTLTTFGAGVLVGGSGMGKSTVARAVAVTRARRFFMVEFRDADANDTRHRLDIVFALIGGLPPSTLILDDLNHLNDTLVELSLSRVIEALRRRDRAFFITCHRAPSSRTLSQVGLSRGCITICPCFSEKETHALVRCNGGDPTRWGRLAHLAGASGHPQLTHAFVAGLAARDWPATEISDILKGGLSTGDIDATRDAARHNLMSVLPEGARVLLYRLSVTIGRFNRALALVVGQISPPVFDTGECLDRLIGSWIDVVGDDQYRVSPLAANSGRKMLSSDEQERIHNAIAVQLLRKTKIDASDVNALLVHGIAGKSEQSLVALTGIVATAEPRTIEVLAEHIFLLRFFSTDAPIYPTNSFVSGLLRITQFKLAAAADDGLRLTRIVAALFNDIRDMPESDRKNSIESLAVVIVLCTMGVANHLDNWITILQRLKTMVESNVFLKDLLTDAEDAANSVGTTLFCRLFAIGSANLASIERLEHIINDLDTLKREGPSIVADADRQHALRFLDIHQRTLGEPRT